MLPATFAAAIDAAVLKNYPDAAVYAVMAEDCRSITAPAVTPDMVPAGVSGDKLAEQPAVAGWRKVFSAQGLKSGDYRSSLEALLRRLTKGQDVATGVPAVDLYNAMSVTSLAPMGAYDLDKLSPATITLRYATPDTDTFAPIGGKAEDFPLTDKLIIYAQDTNVLCWGVNCRDSAAARVEASSARVVFFAEGLNSDQNAAAKAAILALRAKLAALGLTVSEALVTKAGTTTMVPVAAAAAKPAALKPRAVSIPPRPVLNVATITTDIPQALTNDAKSWPFVEARNILKRIGGKTPEKGYVLFQTGYGPSGFPHIGTFGEVVRTTMVRNAFIKLTDGKIPTKMFCISDDMDGMRKIPDTIPDPSRLTQYMQFPLTSVPDPFGTHESYGAHMNARLCSFLDSFGFDYEFHSSTTLYKNGTFDAMLRRAAERYDAIMNIMLPTLGTERQATYSPFLPISPKSGRVLYVPMKSVDAKAGTITFTDEDGTDVTLPVTGGHVKLQWKPDFAMRWAALGVDFEMFGKDHQANAPLYSEICRTLGANPPEQFVYELFLDDKGEKISKSKGNGIAVEEWLTYAPQESLALFQWLKPQTAKRLYFDVIPRAVDDYLTYVEKFPAEEPAAQLENPVWAIHGGKVPAIKTTLSFGILLNLAGVASAEDEATMWKFISRYAPGATPASEPFLAQLVTYAVRYYQDFVKPTKSYRTASGNEYSALQDLQQTLARFNDDSSADEIQTEVFEVGKRHGFEKNLKDWFSVMYNVLLGQETGPRMGTFIKLYGLGNTQDLIRDKLQAKAA